MARQVTQSPQVNDAMRDFSSKYKYQEYDVRKKLGRTLGAAFAIYPTFSLVVDVHQLSGRCLAFAIFPAIAPLALSFPAALSV